MSRISQEGVVAMIERHGELLAIRRAEGILAGGHWCLPGGGIEPGETPAEAVVREVREEVGLDVHPGSELWQWVRPDGRLRLYWWRVHLAENSPDPIPTLSEVAEVRWVRPEQFRQLTPILQSNIEFLDFLGQTSTVGA